MIQVKYLLPALAALALVGCATTGTDKTASGDAKVAKVFKWEVKPNNPFRTEEGPIEEYDAEADNAIFAARNARRPVK